MRLGHGFLILIMAAALFFPSQAPGKTRVLITVDVESLKNGSPKTDIWGRLDGFPGMYGVPKIIEIMNKHHAKATFYLNVYEKNTDDLIEKIAEKIVADGHDLQLHTHPKPMYGKSQMQDYPLEKQVEILKKGCALLHDFARIHAIAHRAGDYAANLDTIKAMSRIGMEVDSSLSPAWSSPLYAKDGLFFNDIKTLEGVLEIPVTFFSQVRLFSFDSIKFLDICSSSLLELKTVLSRLAAENACAANVMMHSFSFIRDGRPDMKIIQKLDDLLSFIDAREDLAAVGTSDFYHLYRNKQLACTPRPDFVPHTGIYYTYLRAWDRFDYGWKNKALALLPPGLAVFFAVCGFWLVRRKKAV